MPESEYSFKISIDFTFLRVALGTILDVNRSLALLGVSSSKKIFSPINVSFQRGGATATTVTFVVAFNVVALDVAFVPLAVVFVELALAVELFVVLVFAVELLVELDVVLAVFLAGRGGT
jgi:hypothetical protein